MILLSYAEFESELMSDFPYKTVWRLAAPNIASNIMFVSTMVAHMYIVAPLGAEASAAVVSVTRVSFLLMATAMALSVATTAMVARAWGAKNYEEANKSATSALGMSLLVSCGIAAPVFFLTGPIAAFFSAEPQVIALTRDMLPPIAWLSIIYAVNLSISTNYRAIGNVVAPLKIAAISAIGNITLAYGLTMGAFGLPALGPQGIPIGAVLSQVVITSVYVLLWALRRYEIKPDWRYFFNKKRFRQLIHIGLPAAAEQYVIQIGSIIIMGLLSFYGTEAFVAYGIGINILSVCIVIGLGFGSAGATLSGQKVGAGDPKAAKESGYIALRMALFCMCFIALLIYIWRTPLSFLLTDNPTVAAHAELFIIILAICQPLMAVEFAIGGTLRGAGDTRFPMYATMVGTIGARIIMAYICVWAQWPLWAIYSLVLFDFLIKATAFLVRVNGEQWVKPLDHTPPAPLQSAYAINRSPVREYYRTHPDDMPDDIEK